jgi:ethanolamine utilization protein EutA
MLSKITSVLPAIITHEWEEDHYHDHDDFALDHNPQEDGLWQSDNVELISVGIDIGSSGTQVVFSRITLQRGGDQLSSRYFVVSREQLYQSPVSLTPYAAGLLIDKTALGAIIDDAYNAAGLAPSQVDTGAVILTGEALRRENAHNIADILAAHGGDFVCTMAGHHIEAMLAAYGSGAAWASNEQHKRVLNIDIGGGTTKFAILESGRVTATAAIHIGGRLHVYDSAQRLTRLEPSGQALAASAGFNWQLDDQVPNNEKDAVAAWMARAIVAAVTEGEHSPDLEVFWLTEKLPRLDGIEAVMFSGGVSEFVYGHEDRDFSDMGKLIGIKLGQMLAKGELPWAALPAGAGIRATALGLSEYSVQLSGNTIYVPDPEAVLPRRNLRVMQPAYEFSEVVNSEAIALAITDCLNKFDVRHGEDDFVLAFHWSGTPRYERIAAFAKGLVMGMPDAMQSSLPVYVVIDGDIARTLGRILQHELHVRAPLLIVDGVNLADFDYIDFGTVRIPSNTVPITIKSLLFSKDPRMAHEHNNAHPHEHEHNHHHPHDHTH